jgi:hypothetical protein
MINDSLFDLFRRGLLVHHRNLVGLPLRMGGLGITQARDVALSAYVGSLSDTHFNQKRILGSSLEHLPLPHIEKMLDKWKASLVTDAIVEIDDEESGLSAEGSSNDTEKDEEVSLLLLSQKEKAQHFLTGLVHVNTLKKLEQVCDAHFQMVLKANQKQDSNCWTNVFPAKHLGLWMDAAPFRMALCFRLGLNIFGDSHQCSACNANVDSTGSHFGYCNKVHIRQHDGIRDFIRLEASRAHLQPLKREPLELLERFGRENERPADVLIPHLVNGQHLCIDVSIVNTYTHKSKGAQESGYCIKLMEETKRNKYESALEQMGLMFTPFVIDSFGGMGSGCDIVLDKIGVALADVDHLSKSRSITRFKSRIIFKWMTYLGYSLAEHAVYSSIEM